MVRRLDLGKTKGIEQLFASRMSRWQIESTNRINQKSVDRHLATFESNEAFAYLPDLVQGNCREEKND